MKRLTGRRTCSLTGKLLNVYYSSQQELDECTSAGGELVHRVDDNEETIGNRLQVYRKNTEPLIEFYSKRNKLTTIDAEGAIDAVYERLLAALESQDPESR
jgi:adenylate kinase